MDAYYFVLCELLSTFDKSRRVGSWSLRPNMRKKSIFLPKRLTSQLVAVNKELHGQW